MGWYQWQLFVVVGFGWASDNLWPVVTSLIFTVRMPVDFSNYENMITESSALRSLSPQNSSLQNHLYSPYLKILDC